MASRHSVTAVVRTLLATSAAAAVVLSVGFVGVAQGDDSRSPVLRLPALGTSKPVRLPKVTPSPRARPKPTPTRKATPSPTPTMTPSPTPTLTPTVRLELDVEATDDGTAPYDEFDDGPDNGKVRPSDSVSYEIRLRPKGGIAREVKVAVRPDPRKAKLSLDCAGEQDSPARDKVGELRTDREEPEKAGSGKDSSCLLGDVAKERTIKAVLTVPQDAKKDETVRIIATATARNAERKVTESARTKVVRDPAEPSPSSPPGKKEQRGDRGDSDTSAHLRETDYGGGAGSAVPINLEALRPPPFVAPSPSPQVSLPVVAPEPLVVAAPPPQPTTPRDPPGRNASAASPYAYDTTLLRAGTIPALTLALLVLISIQLLRARLRRRIKFAATRGNRAAPRSW